MGVKFKKSKLQKELNFCNDVASKYFENESKDKLKSAARDLDFIFKSTKNPPPWQIERSNPLKIICNDGNHESDGKGINLQGRLSFIWELKKSGHDTLELGGKASTVIAIHKCVGSRVKNKSVLQWNVDIVTNPTNAPGPVFHTQIKNPKNLPVPRLPSFLFSPVDCLDFLLGELFQERWQQHQSSRRNRQKTQRLASIQNPRLRRLITKQKKALKESGFNSSAWIALKNWEPADDIFL